MSQHILVVGAGSAGLMAGRTLHDLGHSVTVLEARNRIGGRTWTNYDFAPHPIEYGAEFIHGSKVMTWQLLKKYKLDTLAPFPFDNVYATLNGTIDSYYEQVSREWDEEIWDAAEKSFFGDDPEMSLRSLLDKQGWLTDHESEMARLVNNTFASDYGADLDQLSTGYVARSYEGDGAEIGDYQIKRGYSALMTYLADGLDIRLNTVIEKIDYTSNKVRITTVDGAVFEASQAIITLPLGVLKSGTVIFEPALPAYKQTVIERLGAGMVNKLILKFNDPFWKALDEDFIAIYTARDSQLWWRTGWGHDQEQAILTAFAGGKAGASQSLLSEDGAIERSLTDLRETFGRDVRDLFEKAHFINWGNDPYSQMGYSYDAVGSKNMRKALSKPIGNTFYFAGEACHTIRPQTVHGALETGRTVAQDIHTQIHGK